MQRPVRTGEDSAEYFLTWRSFDFSLFNFSHHFFHHDNIELIYVLVGMVATFTDSLNPLKANLDWELNRLSKKLIFRNHGTISQRKLIDNYTIKAITLKIFERAKHQERHQPSS